MKKPIVVAVILCSLVTAGAVFSAEKSAGSSGAAKFKEHCSMCHPDGGNIINPKKTLHAKDREANGIKTAGDIIKLMRKPGPGMTTFTEKDVPETDAKAIANYVVSTFK